MDKLTEMNVFAEVARNSSFSAAARKLGLSPSSVSKIITRMEQRLGSRLFNRTTRKLHLTEGGQRFLERCVDILVNVEQAEEMLLDDQHTVKGTLTINSSPGFAHHQLIPLIPKFSNLYPNLEINLQLTGEKSDLIKQDIDLAIRLGQLQDSNLIARKLGECRRIICASPSYLKKYGTPEIPDDLKDHNCLRLSTNPIMNNWDFTVSRKKQTLQITGNIISDRVDAIHDLMLKGMGIARLSEFMIGKDIQKGRLIPLLEKYHKEQQQIHIVYPHREHLPVKTRLFIEYMIDVFTPTPPWQQ